MPQSELQFQNFTWIDLSEPGREQLQQLAAAEGISKRIMTNCLDTDFLPQLETYGLVQFVILRLIEPNSKLSANTVQKLTTKIALFVTPEKIITVHRLPLKEIELVRAKLLEAGSEPVTKQRILALLYEQVSLGFDQPLTDLEQKLDQFEEKLFSAKKSKTFIQEGFYLKRKASAFRKVLKLSLDLLNKFVNKLECTQEQFQESKDRLERCLFYADDVYENTQSLLNLHMSIESQRTNEASFKTNEIMRVLTVLTIFFLPLNFLAGVFGMNFAHMPLLNHEYGFWLSVILMLLISGLLGYYLLMQGWLSKPDIVIERDKSN